MKIKEVPLPRERHWVWQVHQPPEKADRVVLITVLAVTKDEAWPLAEEVAQGKYIYLVGSYYMPMELEA